MEAGSHDDVRRLQAFQQAVEVRGIVLTVRINLNYGIESFAFGV